MVTSTNYFPGGLYPNQYDPALPDFDYNPEIGGFLEFGGATVISKSATSQVLQLASGLKLKLVGTGFTFDANGYGTAGTLTSLQVLKADGTTLVHTVTGITRPLESFYDTVDAQDSYGVGRWLLNGNDTLVGSAGADDLIGYAGNDTLRGGGGDDFMEGGAGKDTYDGGEGGDLLSFQDAYFDAGAYRGILLDAVARTVIDPWGNSETFTSIEGFRGSQFADVMKGSAADEQFMGLGGRDTIDGGGGVDTVRYDRDERRGGDHGVTINLTTGVAVDGFGRADKLSNIENIRATNFDDTLTGNAAANQLRGFSGKDVLNGLAGADTMQGGAGDDRYVVDNAGDVVDEERDDGNGIDLVTSSVSFNLGGSKVLGIVENLTLAGSKAIDGTGNGYANILTGNSGANTLSGGIGADTLIGGLGRDVLTGGDQNDIFDFNVVAESANTRATADVITDFTAGDKIDVSTIDASTASGNQAFVLDTNSVFAQGEIRQTLSGGDLILTFNTDTDSAAEMTIVVADHGLLTASDFVL